MKKIVLMTVISIFLSTIFAKEKPSGFGPINFGENKPTAIKKLVEKYNLKKNNSNFYTSAGNILPGFLGMSIYVDQSFLTIKNFSIDETPFTVKLFFTKSQNKFYGYTISSSEQDIINYLEIRKYGDFLADIFEYKFGTPSAVNNYPDIFKVRENLISPYKIWDISGFDVKIGVTYNFKYYIQAVVFKLKEKEVEQKEGKKQYLKRIEQASKQF